MDDRSPLEVEPYTQYWLSDRYQRLHAMFGSRRGSTIRDAVEAYIRSTPSRGVDREVLRTGLERAAAQMRAAGLLVGKADEVSHYDNSVVSDYVHHRAFPTSPARLIARQGKVRRGRADARPEERFFPSQRPPECEPDIRGHA
jgi:hypothetical protein